MRLWSLHPVLLDRAALVAGWREALLAQAVLVGATRGYTHHPQLERFRAVPDPTAAIGHYLCCLQSEATARGYRFDATRIRRVDAANPAIAVTDGQLAFELEHLRRKVAQRASAWLQRLPAASPAAAPSFTVVPGPIASWERP